MKKMLFLMLFLLILGAANVNSQVRIGGNGVPNGAAVLDLNATDVINNGTKGLALPRVSLSTNTVQITSGTPNLSGMLVYNTNTTLGAGVYYWNGSNWVKVTDGSTDANTTYSGSASITLSGTSFQRAALTGDVTAPANSNTTSIAAGAVQTDHIKNDGVTLSKLKTLTILFDGPLMQPGAILDTVLDKLPLQPQSNCAFLPYGNPACQYAVYDGTRRMIRIRNNTTIAAKATFYVLCFVN